MSAIKEIINNEQGREVQREYPEFEAQERNIALLKALDVLADNLERIAKAIENQ